MIKAAAKQRIVHRQITTMQQTPGRYSTKTLGTEITNRPVPKWVSAQWRGPELGRMSQVSRDSLRNEKKIKRSTTQFVGRAARARADLLLSF